MVQILASSALIRKKTQEEHKNRRLSGAFDRRGASCDAARGGRGWCGGTSRRSHRRDQPVALLVSTPPAEQDCGLRVDAAPVGAGWRTRLARGWGRRFGWSADVAFEGGGNVAAPSAGSGRIAWEQASRW